MCGLWTGELLYLCCALSPAPGRRPVRALPALRIQCTAGLHDRHLLPITLLIYCRLIIRFSLGWGQFSVVRHYMLSVRVVAGRINLVMTIPPSSSVSFSRFKLCKHWSGSRYTQDQKHWARKRWKIINFTLCFYSAYEYLILMISQEESD